ncbi:MAG TPA: hypothetical protein VFM15_06830 [Gammaproteobacteria bacterium]|nr:hypothetical protein [Gammaproteobacteria bacterium]
MMRIAVKLLIACALVVYPIAIYFADDWFTPSQFIAGLLLLLAIRLVVITWIKPEHLMRNLALTALFLIAAVAVILWLPGIALDWLRLYPTLFNLVAFLAFFISLFSGMPLAERMARLVHPDLPSQAVAYTRRVTQVWCAVLLSNTFATLYTALATSFETWTLYNGVITYLLFGAVFVGEFLVRTHLKRKWAAT